MMKRLIILTYCFLTTVFLMGQTVKNVVARQVGKQIEVSYDLTDKADINLEVIIDGRYKQCKSVSGDVGYNITSGHKRIVWDVLADMEKLEGDDVRFKVNYSISTQKLARQIEKQNRLQDIHPMSGADIHGGGVGFGASVYWGYKYYEPCRWGSYLSYTYGIIDYAPYRISKDDGGYPYDQFHNIYCGATCVVHRNVALFLAPGLNIRKYYKVVQTLTNDYVYSYNVTTGESSRKPFYATSRKDYYRFNFAFEAGIGIRCNSMFLLTLRASYPLYIGLGIGIDLGWY